MPISRRVDVGKGRKSRSFIERAVGEMVGTELRPTVASADVLDADLLGDRIQGARASTLEDR